MMMRSLKRLVLLSLVATHGLAFLLGPSRLPYLEAKKSRFFDDDERSVHQTSALSASVVAQDENKQEEAHAARLQYAALEPGTVVQIQVGDIHLARKAWKKRRRSGSPLLVPCSVLNVDRTSTVRWNLIYLLDKFGIASSNNKNSGIRISLKQLKRRYQSHLNSGLTKHASLLGFDTVPEMMTHLFNARAQETYGVKLITEEGDDGEQLLWLHSAQSRMRAQKRANQAAILQFADEVVVPGDDAPIQHTGWVRNKESDNTFQLLPLSAALRVSQKEDVETGNIQNGSFHPAVVLDYDPAGDAGSPLLTLSLNPTYNRVRDRLKLGKARQQHVILDDPPSFHLKDLTVGQGPMKGKVLRLIKGGALVDCGVGRAVPKHKSEYVQVLGFLRFDDTKTLEHQLGKEIDEISSLMEAEDEGEDITHLYDIGDDGSLLYKDEETGETQILSTSEGDLETDGDSDDDDDDDDDGPVVFQKPSKQKRLHVGDELDVFVKSVSKQNAQLQLTLDPTIQGKKAINVKRESQAEKKKARLSKQMGGIERIKDLQGSVMDGIVIAESKTGDWLYVQPIGNLPVGLAKVPKDLLSVLGKGDSVVVRLDGMDTSRGQLSLQVLDKK